VVGLKGEKRFVDQENSEKKYIEGEIRSAYFQPVSFRAVRIVSTLVGKNSYRSVSSVDSKCDNYAIINFR